MDKKLGQFTDEVAESQHLVLQGNSLPAPGYTLLTAESIHSDSSLHQRSKQGLNLQRTESFRYEKLISISTFEKKTQVE